MTLDGEAVDRALAAMGDFADLVSPYLVGHSSGVAELAVQAGGHCGLGAAELAALRRGAFVHDVGRVAVSAGIWQKPGPLTPDEWEHVRLHAYQSERVLAHAPLLAALAPVATAHHERLDGSGYHRQAVAAALSPPARLLAAADAYHAMTEPRPHRDQLSPAQAAEALGAGCPRRPTRQGRGRRRPGGCRAAGPPVRTARGADRARGRGHRSARPRAADQADRSRPRDLCQDR